MFSLYYFMLYYQKDSYDRKLIVLLILSLGITLGTKSPYGCILLLIIGLNCICDLIRKRYKKAFTMGIGALGVFAFIFCFVLYNTQGASESIGGTNPPIYFYVESIRQIHDQLVGITEIAVLKVLLEGVFTIFYLALANPFVFFWLAIMIILKFRKKDWKSIDIVLLIAILVGILITIYVGMYGISNMYFYMAIILIEVLFIVLNSREIRLNRTVIITGAILLSISTYNWLSLCGANLMSTSVNNGIRNYSGNIATDIDKTNRSYISMQQSEVYEYIRLNTEGNSLFISNREHRLIRIMRLEYLQKEVLYTMISEIRIGRQRMKTREVMQCQN